MEGSWTWGGNPVFGMYTLGDLGFLDFAGSGIVHMAGAAAALGRRYLGRRAQWEVRAKRRGECDSRRQPASGNPWHFHSVARLVWFQRRFSLATATVDSANAVAVVFMNTNLAAAGGCIGALILAKVLFGKADLTMALNGCLAGLVAITAGPDTPSALQATIFGALGGLLVVFSITTLDKLKIDDPVGAISVHGTVGLLGLLLVPVTNGDAFFFRPNHRRDNHLRLGLRYFFDCLLRNQNGDGSPRHRRGRVRGR